MAANVGRELIVKRGSTVIAGLRTKSISFNGEPIDITTDDDSGYRTLLGDPATLSIDMSVDGITKDNSLRNTALSGGTLLLTNINVTFPNGDTITGDFYLASVEESGAYNDALTFSASFQSSGAWTYTPVV